MQYRRRADEGCRRCHDGNLGSFDGTNHVTPSAQESAVRSCKQLTHNIPTRCPLRRSRPKPKATMPTSATATVKGRRESTLAGIASGLRPSTYRHAPTRPATYLPVGARVGDARSEGRVSGA